MWCFSSIAIAYCGLALEAAGCFRTISKQKNILSIKFPRLPANKKENAMRWESLILLAAMSKPTNPSNAITVSATAIDLRTVADNVEPILRKYP